jgi:hypothetical protein
MPMFYSLFISHAWKFGENYDRLVNLLNQAPDFLWLNWSEPEDEPGIPEGMTAPDAIVLPEIIGKITLSECVLVIADAYVNHSAWIKAEMDIARQQRVPIIGVKPRGEERMPEEVSLRVVEEVGWDTDSIVDAVRRVCAPREIVSWDIYRAEEILGTR